MNPDRHSVNSHGNKVLAVKARNIALVRNLSEHPKSRRYFGPGRYVGHGRYLGPMDNFFSPVSAQYVSHQ